MQIRHCADSFDIGDCSRRRRTTASVGGSHVLRAAFRIVRGEDTQSRDPLALANVAVHGWCGWFVAPTSSVSTISGVTNNPPQVSEPVLQGFESLHE